jgi:hypothetical protein
VAPGSVTGAVSEQLLNLLTLCLLALLYLFFLRVLRAVWVEVRAGAAGPPPAGGAAPAPPAPRHQGRRGRDAGPGRPRLVVLEPPGLRGAEFPLGDELTVGRAAGCAVTLDDTFVSQLHARVFVVDGHFMVEDLGSTNGTFLNRRKVGGPEVLSPGDLLQVGNTVMELR